MSPPWSALLVLILLDEAGSVRPVVTFHPNWSKIFPTESVNMSCDVRSPVPGDTSYVWYKDTTRTHTGPRLVITDAKEGDRGDYACESATSGRSDPSTLDVEPYTFTGWVILQVPLHVHEGDDVTLRCHHYPGYRAGKTAFYKDNDVIRTWGSDPQLRIKDINGGRSHKYKCTKEVQHHGVYYRYSAESSITVRELFSTPEIRVTASPITEGDHVTVTCHSNVSPYRPETPLTFAFLKDGRNVQSFGKSDQYGVRSAHPEDSGKYSCEVSTVSGRTIVRRSDEIKIEVNAFTQPEVITSPNVTAEGDAMTLTCHTRRSPLFPAAGLHFAFYKDGRNVQEFSLSDQYGVRSTQAKHSGNYSCQVRALSNNLTKSSEELDIHIHELFSAPEMKMIPDEVMEGHPMTLTCYTRVLRNNTDLQFAFYKNKMIIREFIFDDRYEVPSAQPEDSGDYFCEVRTPTDDVKKRSEGLNVTVRGSSNFGLLMTLPLALGVLLVLVVILVTFFICYKRCSSIKPQEPASGDPSVSSDRIEEAETTYSVVTMHPMAQSAPAGGRSEDQENNVVYAAVKSKSRRRPAPDPDSIYQNL